LFEVAAAVQVAVISKPPVVNRAVVVVLVWMLRSLRSMKSAEVSQYVTVWQVDDPGMYQARQRRYPVGFASENGFPQVDDGVF
jgi:hypothetical protein